MGGLSGSGGTPHPSQSWGAGGLTMPKNLHADLGAGRDGGVGGNDAAVLLKGFSDEVLLCVRQVLPTQHLPSKGHEVIPRDLQ